ncbi:hypothetical protein H6P81_006248 [Aristolochia fimbriata]|uniref:Uncharacterized protein n=1 Tax=Aristolochia fimbriata TaxID=158543 RepID=A0AAV7EXS2_ARIFI|nr:hypothetical protein H6P81_006248 [Aristolochia fimbriata]
MGFTAVIAFTVLFFLFCGFFLNQHDIPREPHPELPGFAPPSANARHNTSLPTCTTDRVRAENPPRRVLPVQNQVNDWHHRPRPLPHQVPDAETGPERRHRPHPDETHRRRLPDEGFHERVVDGALQGGEPCHGAYLRPSPTLAVDRQEGLIDRNLPPVDQYQLEQDEVLIGELAVGGAPAPGL